MVWVGRNGEIGKLCGRAKHILPTYTRSSNKDAKLVLLIQVIKNENTPSWLGRFYSYGVSIVELL